MPHRAGVTHRRAQHLAERLEAARHQAVRIVRGQAPVLSGRIELVRRRTDRKSAQHDALRHPGVGAAGIDADRSVEIEADGKAVPARDVAAAFELALGVPLQEFVKVDLVGMALPQSAQRLVGRARAIPSGHSHHAPECCAPQRLECREAFERAAALLPIGLRNPGGVRRCRSRRNSDRPRAAPQS